MSPNKSGGKRYHPRMGHDGLFWGSSSRVHSSKASRGGRSQNLEEDELKRSIDRKLKGKAERRGLKAEHC